MLASENYKISVLERESHLLDREINGLIRECLAREGHFHEPSQESKRLVSGGHRNAERRSPRTTRRAMWWLSATPTSGSASRGR